MSMSGLASLFSMMARGETDERDAERCCCFKHAGDNADCPVHFVRVVDGDGTVRKARVVWSSEDEEERDGR